MDAALEHFERDGYAVLDFAQLADATIEGYLRHLTPWADSQMAPNGAQPAVAHADSYWQGTTRLAASNAVLELPDTAALTLDFMLGKELLRFSELALKTPAMRIDSIQIACYPRVGEGQNEGYPPPSPELASSELQGWHRDTGNWHNQLRQFHLRNESHRPAAESSESAAADESDRGPPLRPDGAPVVPGAVNFMTYLQDSELRVLPGSHADFTELSFGQFNLTEQAKLPHPRERCILCKPGQVIAFHHNLLHSGMLNDSQDTRRFYVSLFYTRLGLPSRNLPSLVSEAEAGHPIHAVLDRAVEERDEQVLSLFGVEGRLAVRAAPVTPYDFLVSLGTAEVTHARTAEASNVGAPVPGAFLGHLSATSALLASWGCNESTANAGLFHSIYGTAAFDLFSLPMNAEQRQVVTKMIGEEAERVVFINCSMERGSQDTLHAAVLRNPDLLLHGKMAITHRPGLDLAEAGWGEVSFQ